MKKDKKILWCILGIATLGIYILRVYSINSDLKCPDYREYSKETEVAYETDFTNNSNECIEGYTVEVISSEIISENDFYKKYNLEYDSTENSKIIGFCLVNVCFSNKGNLNKTDVGINLWSTPLVTTNDYIVMDSDYFMMLNQDMPGISFSLKPNTSKNVTLVYLVRDTYYQSITRFEQADFKLQITEYPTRKVLKIK